MKNKKNLIGIPAIMVVLGIAGIVPAVFENKEKTTFTDETVDVVYCAPAFDREAIKNSDAPLLPGLGSINYAVTTKSDKAKQYFNQGLMLTYGFNHGESARSFKTALRLDSSFAMAYWGLAMVLGPNYNAALDPTGLADINDAVDKAVLYSKNIEKHEKALIHAMSHRFPKVETKDMMPFYEAYAASMKEAHEKFPNDSEIATLYADALMNLHPWNLWLKDGTAQPWTAEIITLLEKTLKHFPDHPGAIHYYIHATEASKNAGRAIPYADKLANLAPNAGHLVHMPAHTYIRTGDYHKGVLVTEMAGIADSTYIAQCKVQGAYPLMYYPHNIHFLAACAFLEGNSRKAIDAAWQVARNADKTWISKNVSVQHFSIIPFYVLVHLGKWEEILQLTHPGDMKYPAAIWHYARGMAFAAKGNMERAGLELKALKKFAADESLASQLIWEMNSAKDLVNIAAYMLEGELLAYNKQYDMAVSLFKQAIEIEDRLTYTEPPDWFFSVRLTLGHWLIKAERFEEAEKCYNEDLALFPKNGWALRGLYNSLNGQDRFEEAKLVKREFEKAWEHADIPIHSSRVF